MLVIIIFSSFLGAISLTSATGFISSEELIGISSSSVLSFFFLLNKPNIFLNISERLTLNVRTDANIAKITNITIEPVFPNKP